jgi:protein phosphatase
MGNLDGFNAATIEAFDPFGPIPENVYRLAVSKAELKPNRAQTGRLVELEFRVLDEARHPYRHVVTNVLGGAEPGVRVELHRLDLHPGDVLLLCSDGLTEMVPDGRIAVILREEHDPRRACERLVAEANRHGGTDDITAIVAHVGGPASRTEAAG